MGNEQSSPIDENEPSVTLSARSVEAVAEFISSGRAKNIVVMTGAGISTSAGIPDFRSPETGLYANLARLNLPYAEAVFDINFFRSSPEPFYALAHELYPGKFRPTVTHSFIRLLHDKGLLLKLFTQNIDCLERAAGLPDEKIIEAHGSFARQSCIDCGSSYPRREMETHVAEHRIPRCFECQGLVKPEIVFFGEQLPAGFFRARMLPQEADLCIVMGTSLSVQPFASLPDITRHETPRLLINKERVGGLGTRADDVLLLEACDLGVRKLAHACGWGEELETLWARTAMDTDSEQVDFGKDNKGTMQGKEVSDETFEDEVEKLTKEVEATLGLSRSLSEKVLHDHPTSPKTSEKNSSMTARPSPAPAPASVDAGAHSKSFDDQRATVDEISHVATPTSQTEESDSKL